ncbi:MAG TPA: FAD-dependent monooxygenase [Candidatus Angelobacter sp.]|nr:FAD-dependent monooxygenase [Candidatus Angelobacter sp.]
MIHSAEMENQVLIVGAGPTGLVLALWLAKSGISFRIVEKNDGPGQASRAMAVQARTLEFYRQLGIANRVIESGIRVRGGHLREGNRVIANFPFDDIGSDISPFPFVLSFPQDDHEHLLVKCLEEAGIRVEWSTQLVQCKEEGQQVNVILRKGDAEERCEFAYVCGCDGAHSTVRQGLGLNFPGGMYEQLFYVADVQPEGPAFDEAVNACFSPDSFILAFPVRSSGMLRLIGIVPPELAGRDGLTFEEIRPYVKKQINVDVHRVNWFSTYRVHHRVADHFRQGRVFIAGDAGHIHSPAGGQGMNTGIGDAVNLAWKLATVIHGRTNPAVLDTYESERIAFARTLVATTDRLFQLGVNRDLRARMIRGTFLRYIAPVALRFRPARKAQFRLISQTRIHYRNSSTLSHGAAGDIHGGDRLPWVENQNNFQPLNSLDWQIHIFGAPADALRTLATRWNLPIHSFSWDKQAQSAGFTSDAVYLVRPDGHIAFAQSDRNTAQLEKFLSEWLTPK